MHAGINGCGGWQGGWYAQDPTITAYSDISLCCCIMWR